MSDNERAKEQAQAQLACIKEMVAALECDFDRLEELKDEREDLEDKLKDAEEADADNEEGDLDIHDAAIDAREALTNWDAENFEELQELETAAGDCEDEDQARRRIEEDALSVEIRGDWHSPGDSDGSAPTEYKILLCTGGPACQIIGDLNSYNEPETVRLQYQDWFTQWEDLDLDSEDEDALLTYARVFYYGD